MPALGSVPFLRDAPPRALKAAENETKYFGLPGGWQLFAPGEPSDQIYFVLSGSLGAFRVNANGSMELLGHIRAGEPVGEMSMIAGEPHENAVFALRDTELLSMSRTGFMQLVRSDPQILERLTRVIMVRMRQARKKTGRSAEPRVFGLISTSPTIDLKQRARVLATELQAMGLRVAIVGEEAVGMPAAYFDELETRNEIVLLCATMGDTPWFKMTQRYSDRIWLLARADARPSIPLMPEETSPARQFRLVDLVLLHHATPHDTTRTLEWKYAADAARVLHWTGMDDEDCRRLARTMSGKSVGLVLSGGGARAYAHIGVIRALREANCPIDFIGGASMGAIVAAAFACGWSDAEIRPAHPQGFRREQSAVGLPPASCRPRQRAQGRCPPEGTLRRARHRRPVHALLRSLDQSHAGHLPGSHGRTVARSPASIDLPARPPAARGRAETGAGGWRRAQQFSCRCDARDASRTHHWRRRGGGARSPVRR